MLPVRSAVYPRVCGGALSGMHCRSSPWLSGSIPACAGEPNELSRHVKGLAIVTTAGLQVADRVYPRVCGGALRTTRRLSPACRASILPSLWERVYPRVCGGAAVTIAPCAFRERSIPACAGEPEEPMELAVSGVYPRVCGGACPVSSRSPTLQVYPRVCGGANLPVVNGL